MATKKTNSGLCEVAKSMVGQGYWCGCYGQKATQALYDAKIAQYPNGAFPSASVVKQQIADGTFVMDCSGLVKGYKWGLTLTSEPKYDADTDWNQQGMYNRATVKGPISTFPKKTGALLFLGSNEKNLTHVGVYCAEDDKVYHASSPANGVKVSTFKEFGASYWAQYSEIEDDTGLTDGFDAEAAKNTGDYTETLDVDGYWGNCTIKRLQTVLHTNVDGVVSNQDIAERDRNPGLAAVDGYWEFSENPGKNGSDMIRALQEFLNDHNAAGLDTDGYIGPKTITAMQKFFGTTADGVLSAPSDVVKAMQKWMNGQLDVDGYWGKATITRTQEVVGTTADGIVSNQYTSEKTRNPGLAKCADYWEFSDNPGKNGSDMIRAIQKYLNANAGTDLDTDGYIGEKTIRALQAYLGTTEDGIISAPSEMVRALQTWLNNQP